MTNTDWIAVGSIAGVITAFFTALMAIAIVASAFVAKRTLAASKEDSRARTRPVLAAYFEHEVLTHGTILLVIKNFGPSSATNVRVAFDPPDEAADELASLPDNDVNDQLHQRFSEPVAVWAPGWSTTNVVRGGENSLRVFVVTMSYLGPDGTQYEDRFALNPEHVIKETSSRPARTEDPIELGQQAVSALQALVKALRSR